RAAIFSVAAVTIAWLTSLAFATGTMPTLLAAGQSSSQVAAATPATPQMSEKVFKNVQVLKGIPVDEFMGTMGVFTTSLSLCCGNCHTGAGTSNPKWEDDPPRKKTARAMVAMVQDINKTRFGGRQVVTCWTCHRGQLSPSVTPPLDFAYGEAVVRAFDGMQAWWQLPLTVTPQYPLTATLLEGQRFDAAMAFPWKVRNFFNNWRVSFGQTIDGTDVDVIQGSLTSGMIGTLYF